MNKILPIILVVVLSGCSGESEPEVNLEPDNELVNKNLFCKKQDRNSYKNSILLTFINNRQADVCSTRYKLNTCRTVRYFYKVDSIIVKGACSVIRPIGTNSKEFYKNKNDNCYKKCNSYEANCYDSMDINRMNLKGNYLHFFNIPDFRIYDYKPIPSASPRELVSNANSMIKMNCVIVDSKEAGQHRNEIKSFIEMTKRKKQKAEELRRIKRKERIELREKEKEKEHDRIIKERKL